MTLAPTSPRPLDHVVLPTADLDLARARLSALGFTVAPLGVHPFSTVNACVFLPGGVFLEPLAIGDEAAHEQAAEAGNVFVARDRAFRALCGEEGFSALVVGSRDAEADHVVFKEAGVSAGDILSFSRPFIDAGGKSDIASFRLAFAALPDAVPFFFACQRVNAPAVDRGALERHENGAKGLSRVVLVAKEPGALAEPISRIAGAEADTPSGSGFSLDLGNASLECLDPAAFLAEYGRRFAPPSAFGFALVAFGVADLAPVEGLFRSRGVGYEKQPNRLIVPAAPGQGAIFVFEETE